MDLERSLASMGIEDLPWRHETQGWSSGVGPGGSSTAVGWGHLSPQQTPSGMRNVWQDPSTLAQTVNEALGLGSAPSGPSNTWSSGTPQDDYNSVKNIWQPEAQIEPSYNSHHQQRGMMSNGMGDNNADWMRPEANSTLWSDPLKQEDGYWKQPNNAGGWGQNNGGGGGMNRWPQQGGPSVPSHLRSQPPPNQQMGRPPVATGGPPSWAPNGMMTPPSGIPKQASMWDSQQQQRMRSMPTLPQQQPRRYPDVTVPPPIDVNYQGMGGGMRGGAPQQSSQMWKPEGMSGGPSTMRSQPQYGSNNDFPISDFSSSYLGGGGSKPSSNGQFGMGSADDLMWHDPNGELKKWQRDTGVSIWGDPEKACTRPVNLWTVPEGEDEELEAALTKCPVPQKRVEDENGVQRPAFQMPPKQRPIVVTGWGELPENDPNNPIKPDLDSMGGEKWADGSSDSPWFLPTQQSTNQTDGQWSTIGGGLSSSAPSSAPGSNDPHTAGIVEQLRLAVEKRYLDMSILTQTQLPPPVLVQMNSILAKIPALESKESELNNLVESCRPEGETDGSSPQRWMSDTQKVEHNQLIIEVTTLRIEVSELSKKIQRALAEAGLCSPEPQMMPPPQTVHDPYNYSFLE